MKLVFAAGGTGGHINPALAAAGEFRRRHPDAQILFVGTREHMEEKLVPAAGFDFKTIKITGFQRKLSPENIGRNLRTLFLLLRSTSAVKKIFAEFPPDAVVGFGGYVSGPVVRTAAKMGVPTAIHEQNAYPGMANRALAKLADRVMLTVADAAKHLRCKSEPVLTGLPVRAEITAADRDFSRARLGVPENSLMILSMGGSLGAEAINQNMTELIAARHGDRSLFFMHAAGKFGTWMPEKLAEKGVDLRREKNVVVREYIDDMDVCLSACDLVIGRAGASSLSEIEAVGRASVLIPSPNVAENHQYRNARALADRGAARLIEEKDLTPETLLNVFDELTSDKDKLRELGEHAKELAVPNAAGAICEVIESLL